MRLPHVTWLRAFEAAARHSSFSDAADELGLTPAAVSQQIRLLEQHLGTPLFRRLPRGVVLTDMGQAYALPIRKSFAEMTDATDGLFTMRRRRSLRVRASISYAALILAPRLAGFHDLHPGTEITLSTVVWSDRMDDAAIDIDIRYGTGHWQEPGIWPLGDEEAVLVCHPDHLRSFGPDPKVQDVLGAGIIAVQGSEPEWRRLSDRFDLGCPEPPVWLTADSSLMALQTLAAGFGTALIHRSFLSGFLARGELVLPFDYRLPMRAAYYAVTPEDPPAREEIEAFRAWLLAGMPGGDGGGDGPR